MNGTDSRNRRAFEVRLTGEVPRSELDAALHHVRLVRHERTTVVRGQLADQAALHRLLRLVRAYGLEVVDIRTIARSAAPRGLEERT